MKDRLKPGELEAAHVVNEKKLQEALEREAHYNRVNSNFQAFLDFTPVPQWGTVTTKGLK
jgi:hypothetical protein